MVEKLKICCPVCNNEPSLEETSGVICKKCGFEIAFVRSFAGQISKDLWLDKVKKAKNQRKLNHLSEFALGNYFVLTNDSVSFLSSQEKKITIIYANGKVKEEKNVIQYSANERNSAWLYENGTVLVTGDNSYGQCNATGLENIAHVLVAPNCIYAIEQRGSIQIVGAVIDPKIKTWKNITAISCGAFHVVGLTKEGTVTIAGEMIDESIIKQVSQWKNVKTITASTDCSVALFQDGTVAFAGRQNDPRREAQQWTDMISIKADSSYVVGLTKNGEIKLAGYCKPFLDMGRSSAKEWKGIIAITCSRSGIAAITEHGELLVVGAFSGDLKKVNQLWNNNIKNWIVGI